ncbi:MAG: CDP-alcohol phosphatidyltransferase family protein, partial [Spirochaetales bacterium]
KRFLEGCARRLPTKILPDHLTWFGFVGSLMAGSAYVLTNWSKAYLWIASLGFVVNWLGDSLDGTLARVRKIQRPSYGFFMDHNMDALTALVIGVGAGMSPFVSFSVALLLLTGYFLLCIFTYINTYLKEVFKISYGGFGPTELRLALILLNTVFYFGNMEKSPVKLLGISLSCFDLLALGIVLVLFGLYFYFFLSARKEYEKVDPLHKTRSNTVWS